MANKIKKEFIVEGLDCASCAASLEEKVNQEVGDHSLATMNFLTKILTIETNTPEKMDEIIDSALNVVKRVEPDAEVTEKKANLPQENVGLPKKELLHMGIGAVLFATALLFQFPFWGELILYLASYFLIGGEVLLKAIKNIARGQVFDENFLMGIATVGAFAIQEFPEAVSVMLFYQIGELFQDVAVNRSRRSIKELMDIRPDYANLKTDQGLEKVDPEKVRPQDIIVIKPGEKVPLDGKVIEGKSMMDTSALTGESVPRSVEEGSEVLSGFINKSGLLSVEVTKPFSESTVTKILDLVQNASGKKAPTENFITKFAKYYTPVVVVTALLLALVPPLAIAGATFSDWVYRALIFLVVSCPCALVISIPLGFFGGIGGASRNGILIKGGNYLEALNSVNTVVFDKTGTLTQGVFEVTKQQAKNGVSSEKLLEYAALAESFSTHPIAASITKAYGQQVDSSVIENYEEISGHGIKVKTSGKTILAGNAKLMEKEHVAFEDVHETGTLVHVAVDGQYAGYLVISDQVKPDSYTALKDLRRLGVERLVMLTGDREFAGEELAGKLELDEAYTELLPHQKVEKVEEFQKTQLPKKKLVFVGDGINDAPVLAMADIGVAMGGLGSDAAIEAADIVLMTDEPSKLVTAIKIARRTRTIVWQNIVFALAVKLVVLALGAGGIATMWEAVFADVGVAVVAILNAMRVMKNPSK